MSTNQQLKMNAVVLLVSTFLFVGAGGITVKWNTNDGPIVPPTPAPPSPPPQPPFREPAPVWEENNDDIPNPHPYKHPAPPHLFHYFTTTAPPKTYSTSSTSPPVVNQPKHRYTQVLYKPKPISVSTTTLSPAKAFVNAYAQPTTAAPTQKPVHNDIVQVPKQETNYQSLESRNDYGQQVRQTPQLGIRYVPGFGYTYITPQQDTDPRKYDKSYRQHEHQADKYNELESNDVFGGRQHENDVELMYEKQLVQRTKKSPTQYFVPQQPFNYYNQQMFFPFNYQRH